MPCNKPEPKNCFPTVRVPVLSQTAYGSFHGGGYDVTPSTFVLPFTDVGPIRNMGLDGDLKDGRVRVELGGVYHVHYVINTQISEDEFIGILKYGNVSVYNAESIIGNLTASTSISNTIINPPPSSVITTTSTLSTTQMDRTLNGHSILKLNAGDIIRVGPVVQSAHTILNYDLVLYKLD